MARKSTIRSRMGKVSAAVLVTSMAVAGASVAPVATAAQPINLAFLTASSANTWLQTSLTEMKKIAAKNNIKITIFVKVPYIERDKHFLSWTFLVTTSLH